MSDENTNEKEKAKEVVITREEMQEMERKSLEVITSESTVLVEGMGSYEVAPIKPKHRQRADAVYSKAYLAGIDMGYPTENRFIRTLIQQEELPADIIEKRDTLSIEATTLYLKLQKAADEDTRDKVIKINEELAEINKRISDGVGPTAEKHANEQKFAYLCSELATQDGKRVWADMDAYLEDQAPIKDRLKSELILAITMKMRGIDDSFFDEPPKVTTGSADTPSAEAISAPSSTDQ